MAKIYWSSYDVTEQQQTVSNTWSPLILDKQQQNNKTTKTQNYQKDPSQYAIAVIL